MLQNMHLFLNIKILKVERQKTNIMCYKMLYETTVMHLIGIR